MTKKVMQRLIAVLMALALVVTGFTAPTLQAEAATKKATSITLNKSKMTLYVGDKNTISVKSVKPAKASKAVTYKSSNTKVAKVSSKGVVTAVKPGKATITVTSKSNKKVTKKVTVTVKNLVTQTTENKKVIVLKKNAKPNTYTLKTSVTKSNLKFKSSNTKIATVSKNGKITAKKAGTVKITVTGIKGVSKGAKQVITVYVAKSKVKSVSLNKKNVSLTVGKTYKLKATVKPATASKAVVYKSSKPSVATVSSTGKITAKKAGTAKITVTTVDGQKKAVCTVKVRKAATATPVPTETATVAPTATVTPAPTATVTPVPTETAAPVPTETTTPVPTEPTVPTATPTTTPVPEATKEVALVETDAEYTYTLKADADEYVIEDATTGRSVVATKAEIEADRQTAVAELAEKELTNEVIFEKLNNLDVNDLSAYKLFNKVSGNVKSVETEADGTKVITFTKAGKDNVVKVTPVGTDALVIVKDGKTLNITDIEVSAKSGKYTIAFTAKTATRTVNAALTFTTDLKQITLVNTGADVKAANYTETAEGNYVLTVNKAYYAELIDMAGVRDVVKTTTVYNAYNAK